MIPSSSVSVLYVPEALMLGISIVLISDSSSSVSGLSSFMKFCNSNSINRSNCVSLSIEKLIRGFMK